MVISRQRERSVQNKRGGWRANAGRKPDKIKRRHKTFWVSDEEAEKIKEYLLRNRINDLSGE